MELSEYLLETLREDDEFVLYRGEHSNQPGSPSVLLLAPASMQPAPATLKKIEHEYSLRDQLDSAWAVRSLAVSERRGQTTLVLEDPGGETLDRFLSGPMEITQFLRIAVALATALGRVHRQGLIHKDVKPANVLVDDADHVWLTGFGIASRLPRESQAPAPPEIIAGTLAYMAPEQTGRMNRSIDTRSDLYSLGVTLYQMLTGALPFSALDPLEWVHCHIARQPTTPRDRAGVPEPLSLLTMKLLAKNAEERYQTVSGVEADLRRCLADWQSQGRLDPFPLGAHDASDRLLISEKLYGRKPEIAALLNAFDRVMDDGTPALVLVSGYAGVGKSSVVNELHKALVPPRGLFASGKFDQYKREIPYATLAQAFQTLVRQLLAKSEREVGQWRVALAEAVGSNGQLIVNLVPEIEYLIGTQPPVPDLPPQDAKNRFQMVFLRFLGAFARREHPLALFLDDLQWLDAATLELLQRLILDPNVRYLMLVGAYRDNEVSSSHPLVLTLEAIRKAGARVQEIVLAPLRLDDVSALVADALHCELERVRLLAQLVHEKTGGNPFFAIQFLTVLAEEGLLTFEPVTRTWQWDIDRLRAKSYTDNVVDLMVEKLKRFSTPTQEALKQLACLGNVAEVATLALVHGETEEAMHAALWEALRAGLVFYQESTYKFLHDRIQQAAYTLIPDEHRADIHMRIGRALLASMTADQLAEHLFDVANQLNRGAGRLIERDEKTRIAMIDLRAGRKAKASAAYASAREYFSAGMALLDERDWASQYELTFSLWLERAECEFLSGDSDKADQLIAELLPRGVSNVDRAAVYHLKILLHIVKSENPQAVDSALECLRLFGIDLPAHPTLEQVQAEYETAWQTLKGRPIESLVDLPLMTDPELRAAMQILSALSAPAYYTDLHLMQLHVCRMVNVSILHGTSGASAHGFAFFGLFLSPAFHRYIDGYRFTQLACDLVEKHGFIVYKAKVYMAAALVAGWMQPLASAIDLMRTSVRAAIETGDLTYACYGMFESVTNLLLRNDPLDSVWRESEIDLQFARNAKFDEAENIIVSQQRFVATLQGRTATFSTFSDAQFDEATFEEQLIPERLGQAPARYWILKLKARFLSGDYAKALAAADKAKLLLSAVMGQIHLLDYLYYGALTMAALYENARADEQSRWLQLLTAHQEQLRQWAEDYPPTFADKHALVSAEIARLEGRAFDAMRLYEHAIHLARENGFVQNEALAHEVAARFYAARGFETFSLTYLRNARYGYLRWGADGKVRQLDERHPQLRDDRSPPVPTTTIGTPVAHLDLGTVIKVSQAVSGEMVLEKLIERLMHAAIEHAGAERGLLIVPLSDEPLIEAEATTSGEDVTVHLRDGAQTAGALPESLVRYVMRTRESVILDDASFQTPFSADPYIVQRRAHSILCLPLINQTKLIGILYLENNLTPQVFTPDRVTVLKVLASQAAISLENSRLYRDLEDREGKIRRLVDANILGICMWNVEGAIIGANEAFLRMLQYDREDLISGRMRWTDLTPAECRERDERALRELNATGIVQPYEKECFRKDGSRVPVLVGGALFQDGGNEGVAFVLDLSEQKRAEAVIREGERELRQMLDLTPQLVGVFGPNGERLFANRMLLDYLGATLDEWRQTPGNFFSSRPFTHPDDWERAARTCSDSARAGSAFDLELRGRKGDGSYRWFLARYNPIRDDKGQVMRWYAACTDIEDRKRAEDRLQRENVALREEIDKTSMFEEIVGTSPALQTVLSRISKVASSDSTVLITGETGTGKELVARALHRRSDRASRTFVSVNCAAIPRDLIASELFGHEKGAFTGATQQRLGRFELANGGTLFLDEVGELPAETQIALLRVLQEHEFERVGGTRPIRADVRVIAATNRDLQAAISAGSFRSDLFYRLHVFPIEIPPLRQRTEDIPLLVEYFIDRYARKAGKNLTSVDKKTLQLLQSYPWPGNIRELQNVIERSVIVCETPTFSVDESWLSQQPRGRRPGGKLHLSDRVAAQEKEMIEAALRESHGRVYGPSGAAAKLGIAHSTLESKIRSLKIIKNRFKD